MRKEWFVKRSEIDAPVEAVFAFHERPGAVKELIPPWEKVEILQAPPGLAPGTLTILRVFLGPFSRLWVAEHTEYIPNRLFADIQRRGPFAYWYHRHRFEPTADRKTLYTDEVEYVLPFGRAGKLVAGRLTRKRLARMFDYRHARVAERVLSGPGS